MCIVYILPVLTATNLPLPGNCRLPIRLSFCPSHHPSLPCSGSARSHVRGHLRLHHAYVADPSGLPDDVDSLQENAEHDPDWEVVDGETDNSEAAAPQVGWTGTGGGGAAWTGITGEACGGTGCMNCTCPTLPSHQALLQGHKSSRRGRTRSGLTRQG